MFSGSLCKRGDKCYTFYRGGAGQIVYFSFLKRGSVVFSASMAVKQLKVSGLCHRTKKGAVGADDQQQKLPTIHIYK